MNRVSFAVGWFEGILPAVGIILIAAGVALEAVLRLVFDTSILGLEQVTILVGVYTYYISSALASNKRSQIRVTLLDSVSLPLRFRHLLGILGNLISSLVCFAFVYYVFRLGVLSIREHITFPPLGVPYAIIVFSLLLGLLLMGIHHLTQAITSREGQYWDSKGGH